MKRWMYNALLIFFSGVFLVCAVILGEYFIDSVKQQNRFDDLAEIMANAPTTPRVDVSEGVPNTAPTEPDLVDVIDPDTGEIIQVLPEFAELYTMNSDIVGWIRVPNTDIDYPVMFHPESKDYYLRKDFDQNYSRRGSIYVQEDCDALTPSDNVIIHGHRMNDRSMFAQLDNYMKESFYKENPYIYFDTIKELHTYQIVAVFRTSTSVGGDGFPYYRFINAQNADEFNAYVRGCKNLAMYETGVSAEYGDKLITLSTCEFSQTNGRLVIVAKQIA